MRNVNWGIIGTGNIAHQFAKGLQHANGAVLLGVGSRSQQSADGFANEYDIPRSYSTYQQLIDDPEIDIIYISTPNNLHYENTKTCLNAGKAVLCEKPFTINLEQAKELVQLARDKNLFLMEALWSRFFPAYKQMQDWLKAGTIGNVEMLSANFGFYADYKADSRLYDPELGGGSLLDVGIYTLALALHVLGSVKSILAQADLSSTGVDENLAVILQHQNGGTSVLQSSFRTNLVNHAAINGTKGYIRIPDPFWQPDTLYLCMNEQHEEKFEFPFQSEGYQFEAEAAQQCLLKGKIESEIVPHKDTLEIMELMDTIRNDIGLKYPME